MGPCFLKLLMWVRALVYSQIVIINPTFVPLQYLITPLTIPLTLTLASLQDSNVNELTKPITNVEIKTVEVWWSWCCNPYLSRPKLHLRLSISELVLNPCEYHTETGLYGLMITWPRCSYL